MMQKVAAHFPVAVRGFQRVVRVDDVEVTLEFHLLHAVAGDEVAGQQGKHLLLDVGHVRAAGVLDVELMAPGEELALHAVKRLFLLVGDVEAFLEGKHLFLQYQFHAFFSLRVAFSCAIIPQKRPRRKESGADVHWQCVISMLCLCGYLCFG